MVLFWSERNRQGLSIDIHYKEHESLVEIICIRIETCVSIGNYCQVEEVFRKHQLDCKGYYDEIMIIIWYRVHLKGLKLHSNILLLGSKKTIN